MNVTQASFLPRPDQMHTTLVSNMRISNNHHDTE